MMFVRITPIPLGYGYISVSCKKKKKKKNVERSKRHAKEKQRKGSIWLSIPSLHVKNKVEITGNVPS
jgi:hypothetical protein